MTTLLQQLNDALSGVTAAAQRSVVQIRDGRGGQGAGTIWHSDGLIVTNAHVARRDRTEIVLADGQTYTARLLARDDSRDLAALVIEGHGLPVIQPGNSRTLQAGQWVMAVGHPWGVTNAVTGGIVIGVGKQMPELRVFTQDWVVADLQLRPGNSGGPLIDTEGQLVGLNTLMTGPGVGAAVAVDAVKAFLKEALGTTESPHKAEPVPMPPAPQWV
ncbi:MAG: trypsin-like peptidase domain-containing protein [bacterium]|nr:trypsin-like peptidase domain-containing protein [bacterium]